MRRVARERWEPTAAIFQDLAGPAPTAQLILAVVCFACLGDGTDTAGQLCQRCHGSRFDPDQSRSLLKEM